MLHIPEFKVMSRSEDQSVDLEKWFSNLLCLWGLETYRREKLELERQLPPLSESSENYRQLVKRSNSQWQGKCTVNTMCCRVLAADSEVWYMLTLQQGKSQEFSSQEELPLLLSYVLWLYEAVCVSWTYDNNLWKSNYHAPCFKFTQLNVVNFLSLEHQKGKILWDRSI